MSYVVVMLLGTSNFTALAQNEVVESDQPTAKASTDTAPSSPQFLGRDRMGNPIYNISNATEQERPTYIVDEFTANTLGSGKFRLGSELEYGLSEDFDLGIDVIATGIGAPTILSKYRVYSKNEHQVAIGLRAAFLDRKTALWGSIRDHFDELSARYFRPALSWSNRISPRLILHTMFAQGFGEFNAELSPEGKRKLWESKHPGGDYESREEVNENENETELPEASGNQEIQSNQTDSFAQRTLQVSSITGIMADSFQMTGEITRSNGHKFLVSTRFERLTLKDLKASNIRVTAAQQWLWPNFQLRVGVGLQYLVISGRDLDRETIDEAAVLPATELKFYWIL